LNGFGIRMMMSGFDVPLVEIAELARRRHVRRIPSAPSTHPVIVAISASLRDGSRIR
jgi:hypothetical protein